ncbi:MAG: hypothetical protein AAGM38_15880 [Pseudomonadota bacterium]
MEPLRDGPLSPPAQTDGAARPVAIEARGRIYVAEAAAEAARDEAYAQGVADERARIADHIELVVELLADPECAAELIDAAGMAPEPALAGAELAERAACEALDVGAFADLGEALAAVAAEYPQN